MFSFFNECHWKFKFLQMVMLINIIQHKQKQEKMKTQPGIPASLSASNLIC